MEMSRLQGKRQDSNSKSGSLCVVEQENSRINLLDTPDEIAKKVKKAKTDAVRKVVASAVVWITY